MAQTKYQYDNGAKKGSTAWEGTYGSSGGSSYGKEIGSGAPSYLRINNSGKVTDTRNFTFPAGSNKGPSGGGGDAEAYSSGGYHTTNDDIISKIKKLLEEQKKASDEYANTLYQQALAQNKEAYKSNQWQANKNYMRGDRYLQGLYGNGITGQGLSNRARNNSNWQNNLTSIRQNWTNNDASARASYNANLANNASTLAQGWYNYVLPVYTNRQTQLDNLDYRKYLASL